MRRTALISLALLAVMCLYAQDSLRILFAGDAMSHTVQVKWAKTDSAYDYSPCFSCLLPYIDNADYAVVNLEAPLAGKPYTGYPRFSAPDEYLQALSQAGFNLFLLANNHIDDKGNAGLERTIHTLEEQHCPYIGAYLAAEDRSCLYPHYKSFYTDTDSLTVAFFNYTYGTNGLTLASPAVVNLLDTALIIEDLQHMESGADLKIVCVHWGAEYQKHSSRSQQQTAQWLADKGFDLIIGSHPHVVQEYTAITASDGRLVPVFYSLGNFLSNQRWRGSNGGILAQITVDMHSKQIINSEYLPVYVHKGWWRGIKQYHLLPTPQLIDTIGRVALPKADRDSLSVFHRDTQTKLSNINIIN